MSGSIPLPALTKSTDPFANVPDHSLLPRDPKHELFGKVPSEIGPILSADSSLPCGKDGWSIGARGALAAVVAFLLIWLFYYALHHVSARTQVTLFIVGVPVTVLAVYIAWVWGRLVVDAGYVGQAGAYDISRMGRRSDPAKEQWFRFADATELHASQTRHLHKGVYSNTTYGYKWYNLGGKVVFEIIGSHNANLKLPKPGDRYHFAVAAEVAWSTYLLASVETQLQQEGSIPFRVSQTQVVRVGPGFIEFQFGEAPVRVIKGDIAKVNLDDGQFSFKHRDAKWYSSAGKFNFRYSSMPNAKVFLLALDKLMGYRWGDGASAGTDWV